MLDPTYTATLVAWLGFGLAFVFGFVANRAHFCTMGAVSDIVSMGDWRRMRMWLLAIAVAILLANFMHIMGWIDLKQSIYTRPKFMWFSHIVGGFLFGVGMTLASGCGSKTLIRIGNGSVKALVVLAFLAISAFMTLKGLFGILRVSLFEPLALELSHGQDLPSVLAAGTDSVHLWHTAITAVLVLGLLVFVFKDRDFRANTDYMLGGIVIGAMVALGWYVTSHIGYGENPDTMEMMFFGTNTRAAESLTFIAPAAYTLELLALWSDTSQKVTFGIATTIGVIVGSAAYATATKRFRWEGFTTLPDLRNHIIGAMLMGFGGVTALGCTIGQGITGLSTLAFGSLLTFAAIVTGAALTMRVWYARMQERA